MKNLLLLIGLTFVLSSCFKEKRTIKKFEGVWKSSSVETTLYDNAGNPTSTVSASIDAELILRKDSLFTSSGISELTSDGFWAVRTEGKKDLLRFWQETWMLEDFEISVTVGRKSKKEMNIVFYAVDTEGRLISKREYFLKYEQEIDYNPVVQETCNGISFYDQAGNKVCLPVINFINEATSYTPSGGQTINYRRVIVVFSNNLSGAEAKYMELVMNFASQTSTLNPGLYPFNNATFQTECVSSLLYSEGGTSFNALNVQNFNIESGNLNDEKMKGSISQLNLDAAPASTGSANVNNLSFDFDF